MGLVVVAISAHFSSYLPKEFPRRDRVRCSASIFPRRCSLETGLASRRADLTGTKLPLWLELADALHLTRERALWRS